MLEEIEASKAFFQVYEGAVRSSTGFRVKVLGLDRLPAAAAAAAQPRSTRAGQIYMNQGRSFMVERMDHGAKTAVVRRTEAKYYTQARVFIRKNTGFLSSNPRAVRGAPRRPPCTGAGEQARHRLRRRLGGGVPCAAAGAGHRPRRRAALRVSRVVGAVWACGSGDGVSGLHQGWFPRSAAGNVVTHYADGACAAGWPARPTQPRLPGAGVAAHGGGV